MTTKELSEIAENITRLSQREEHQYKTFYGYTDQNLDRYRENYTLRERVILIKNPREFTPEEDTIYKDIWKRIKDRDDANPELQEKRDKRIISIMKHAYKNELLKVFSGQSQNHSEFNKIKITKEAYNKANLIARKIVEVSNSPNEIYLHLLNDKSREDEPTIRDIYIPSQEVSPSHCTAETGNKQIQDERNISDSEKIIMGWGHSHGGFNTFHSSTDETNLNFVTYLSGSKKSIFLDTFSSENPKRFDIWYLPSLVFNAKGDRPSATINIEYREFNSYEPKIFTNESPILEIIEEKNNIDLNQESIDKTIWQRVTPETGFSKSFISQMTRKEERKEASIEQKLEPAPHLEGKDFGINKPISSEEDSTPISRKEYDNLRNELYKKITQLNVQWLKERSRREILGSRIRELEEIMSKNYMGRLKKNVRR